jgi:hypothetical protein
MENQDIQGLGPRPEEGETVQFCPVCRCKTWHFDGTCEWSDGHKSMKPVEAANAS